MDFRREFVTTKDSLRIEQEHFKSLCNEVRETIKEVAEILDILNPDESVRLTSFFYDTNPERDTWEIMEKGISITTYDKQTMFLPFVMINQRPRLTELVKEEYV